MPLFAIIGHDVANSQSLRQQHRPAHLARVEQLAQDKRLMVAGPTPIEHATTPSPAMSGSVIIADFTDLAAAEAWVNADPYFIAGVYSHVDIKPFIQALPAVASS